MKLSFFALGFLNLVIFTDTIISGRWFANCYFETRVQTMDAHCSCYIRSVEGGTATSSCDIPRAPWNLQNECSGPRATSSQGGYQIEMKFCNQAKMDVQIYGPNGEEWSSHEFRTECYKENKRRGFKKLIGYLRDKAPHDGEAAFEFSNNSCNVNQEFDVTG